MSCALSEEVHFDLATNCDEGECGSDSIIIVAKDGGHGIGISEVETNVATRVLSLDKNEGMDS